MAAMRKTMNNGFVGLPLLLSSEDFFFSSGLLVNEEKEKIYTNKS